MKLTKWSILCLSGLALLACKDEKINQPIKAETRTETTKAAELSALPLVSSKTETVVKAEKCFSEDLHCYQIDVQNLITNVDWINQYFENHVRDLMSSDVADSSDEETAKKEAERDKLPLSELKNEYLASIATLFDDIQASPLGYEIEYYPRFIAQNQQIAMFVESFYYYAGGAHGIHSTQFTNFDLNSKKVLRLDDVVLPEQKSEFKHLLEQAYLEYLMINEPNQEKAKQQLQERAEMGWRVEAIDNFTFTYDGMLSLYPPYELGSYAEGEIKLLIPYTKLIGVVKPEFLFNTTKKFVSFE